MWMVWLLGLFLLTSPAFADPGFDEKYERDYNIFNPINQYPPNHPGTDAMVDYFTPQKDWDKQWEQY